MLGRPNKMYARFSPLAPLSTLFYNHYALSRCLNLNNSKRGRGVVILGKNKILITQIESTEGEQIRVSLLFRAAEYKALNLNCCDWNEKWGW